MKEKAIALLLSVVSDIYVGRNLLSYNLLDCSLANLSQCLGIRALIFGSSDMEEGELRGPWQAARMSS
jgi:hypothetical protein